MRPLGLVLGVLDLLVSLVLVRIVVKESLRAGCHDTAPVVSLRGLVFGGHERQGHRAVKGAAT